MPKLSPFPLLTPPMHLILLALLPGDRRVYAIMLKVETLAEGDTRSARPRCTPPSRNCWRSGWSSNPTRGLPLRSMTNPALLPHHRPRPEGRCNRNHPPRPPSAPRTRPPAGGVTDGDRADARLRLTACTRSCPRRPALSLPARTPARIRSLDAPGAARPVP